MTYKVGLASAPTDHDPLFDDERLAIEAAERIAVDDFYAPVAVWDERCEIVHLFICDQHFKPA